VAAWGGATGTGASGQVAYWSGTSTQAGSNNLFWSISNNRLGINTSSPTQPLHVVGNALISSNFLASAGRGKLDAYDNDGVYVGTTGSGVSGRLRVLAGTGGSGSIDLFANGIFSGSLFAEIGRIAFNASGRPFEITIDGSTVLRTNATGIGIFGTPSYPLDVTSTGGIRIALGTTVQRPTGAAGVLRGNSTTLRPDYHNGTTWRQLLDLPDATPTAQHSPVFSSGAWTTGATGIYGGNGSIANNTAATLVANGFFRFVGANGTEVISMKDGATAGLGSVALYSTRLAYIYGGDSTALWGGAVQIKNPTNSLAGNLDLFEARNNGTNRFRFRAPASLSADLDFILPSADGTNGQAIITNGSGTLSFASFSDTNIGNTNLTLSGNRTLTQSGFDLTFSGGDVITTGDTVNLSGVIFTSASSSLNILESTLGMQGILMQGFGSHTCINGTINGSHGGAGNIALAGGTVTANSSAANFQLALGYSSLARGARAWAIGYQSSATEDNSYAIGYGSVADEDNEFSIASQYYTKLELVTDSLTGGVVFSDYGVGLKKAAALSKTESIYNAIYATDGTILEKAQQNNVVSTTTDASGDITVTFATPMPDATYSATVTLETDASYTYNVRSKGTGYFVIRTYNSTLGTALGAGVSVSYSYTVTDY